MPLRKVDGGRSAADGPTEEDLAALSPDGTEGVTGRRTKSSHQVQLYIANLRHRSEGLSGDALQAEIDDFLRRVVDHHASAAPSGPLRDELRNLLRGMIEEDPEIAELVRELREAPGG